MSSFFDEIAAKVAQLSGVATPEVSRDELNEFNVRDIQAVTVSEGGGGGGGNVPFVGVDPPGSPTDGMLWWDPDDDTPAPSDTQPWKIVRVPLAFDTPGLVVDDGGASTGIPVWTPTIGDTLLPMMSYLSITTIWDGTTPFLNLTLTDRDGAFVSSDLTLGNGPNADLTGFLNAASYSDSGGGYNGTLFNVSGPLIAVGAGPLRVVVDDGSSSDPGSMQGEGELVLVVLAAP